MPHVIVKLWSGKSEQQKAQLAGAITKDVMEVLHYGDNSQKGASAARKERWSRRRDGSRFSSQVPSLKELALFAMLLIAMNADLLEAAEALPLPERVELAEAVWENITGEGHEPPVTAAQADELDRRLEEHRRDPKSGIPWEQVKVELDQKYGRAK